MNPARTRVVVGADAVLADQDRHAAHGVRVLDGAAQRVGLDGVPMPLMIVPGLGRQLAVGTVGDALVVLHTDEVVVAGELEPVVVDLGALAVARGLAARTGDVVDHRERQADRQLGTPRLDRGLGGAVPGRHPGAHAGEVLAQHDVAGAVALDAGRLGRRGERRALQFHDELGQVRPGQHLGQVGLVERDRERDAVAEAVHDDAGSSARRAPAPRGRATRRALRTSAAT